MSNVSFYNFNEIAPETCAICREEMTDGLAHKVDEVVSHRFHTDCITPWLTEHETCPLCREDITSINGVDLPRASQRGQELIEAAKSGDEQQILVLLNGPNIPDNYRDLAIINAAKHGHHKTLRYLLLNYSLQESPLNLAMFMAVGNGHNPIVRLLLKIGRVSESVLGKCVIRAVKNQQIDTVRLLLKGRSIGKDYLTQAIREAEVMGHSDVAALLKTHQAPLSVLSKIAPFIATAAVSALMAYVTSYFYYTSQQSEDESSASFNNCTV